MELSKEELYRYSRQIILPEVGVEGQKKLKASSVLVAGAGGLGSPACLYLSAAGIGRIGVVDFDKVDGTNLQRQILYSTNDIGRSKVNAAKEKIKEINPNVIVDVHPARLTSSNALDIISNYDLVIDCTDNFSTRYLINDACYFLRKPFIYGSIFHFEGQVSVFCSEGASASGGDSTTGPCYRCLYPSPPSKESVPNCAKAGVIGVLPGIIGTVQALEAIKLILGEGKTLAGRLLIFDALEMKFKELVIPKDPCCDICGNNPTIHELNDPEAYCNPDSEKEKTNGNVDEISVEELKLRLDNNEDVFLLDVREQYEYDKFNLGGYLIPINSLADRISELDPTREIIVYCKVGGRSEIAAQYLRQSGFKKVKNLSGGIIEWLNKNTSLL